MFTLEGLYRLPASTGDRVCVIDGVADTLCHLADIVGPTGHVCAWPSSPRAPPIQLGGMTIPYQNIRVNQPMISGQLYDPRQLKEIMYELVFGTYRPGHLMKIQNCRESVIKTVMQFIAACRLDQSIQCIVVFYPPDQPPITLDTIGDYEQHLIRTLQPICVLAKSLNTSSYWISVVVRMVSTDSFPDADLMCDRIFDLLAEFAKPSGTIRPKEQLKIDEKFMRGTIMLSARYRKTAER